MEKHHIEATIKWAADGTGTPTEQFWPIWRSHKGMIRNLGYVVRPAGNDWRITRGKPHKSKKSKKRARFQAAHLQQVARQCQKTSG